MPVSPVPVCGLQGKAVVQQRKTEDGESVQVASLGPSEYFGEWDPIGPDISNLKKIQY